MGESKISVIVPVYKVEPYLRKCLDSIVGQTYQNLEILLVDDGSPDNCGAICDEYAIRDKRITVIHKENGGLSSARNAALEIATGDYIGFIDSDDWIEPEMYEHLLRSLEKEKADISVCGHYEEFKGSRRECTWASRQVWERERALEELLKDRQMRNWVWDKLYRRELFDEVRFPEGRTYEDIAVMHWIFLRARRVVCLPEILHHYQQREGSILADLSLKTRMDGYLAAQERYEALREDWPQFEELLIAKCVSTLIGLWACYYENPRQEREKFRGELRECARFARENYKTAKRETNLGPAGRLVLRLVPYNTWWAFALANRIGKLYKWKHGRAL